MTIRVYDPKTDYSTLCGWWEGHKAIPVPVAFLPLGFVAEHEGSGVAACFLYLDVTGKCSMIEYLTTNPKFSMAKKTLLAFRMLIAHCEELSLKQGCGGILSMVAPDTSEERILEKLGYQTSTGVAHRMWGKVITCP